MSKQNEFEVLYNKINNMFDQPNVENNGDDISVREASKLLSYGISPYNNSFIREEKKIVKLMNKKIKRANFLHNDIPRVLDLCPGVSENGEVFVEVLFIESDFRIRGKAVIDNDLNIKFDFLKSGYSEERTRKILGEFNYIYRDFLNILDIFKEYYPNHAYTWNSGLTKGREEIDNGFLCATLRFENADNPTISFLSCEDRNIGNNYCKTYHGYLYETIDNFKFELMKKMPVNVNDLSPLFRDVIKSQLDLENEKTRSLRKETK